MADSLADYSKIQELLEIRRLYEEMQERHQSELDEANSRVEYLETELRSRADATSASGERVHELEEEAERLRRSLQVQRQEYETKIERLQGRVKELSSEQVSKSPPETARSGFFRR